MNAVWCANQSHRLEDQDALYQLHLSSEHTGLGKAEDDAFYLVLVANPDQ